MAIGSNRPVHRHDRGHFRLQGGLHREARAQVRLRGWVEQCPIGFHLIDRESDDDRHGRLDEQRVVHGMIATARSAQGLSVIAQKASATYLALVSLRPLFAMLFAVAMLFAPLASHHGAAMAMAPADHHGQMMESGHCGEQPSKGDHDKAPCKSCCVAMCAAIAVVPSASFEPHSFTASVNRASIVLFHRSFLAELPTPPPRLA